MTYHDSSGQGQVLLSQLLDIEKRYYKLLRKRSIEFQKKGQYFESFFYAKKCLSQFKIFGSFRQYCFDSFRRKSVRSRLPDIEKRYYKLLKKRSIQLQKKGQYFESLFYAKKYLASFNDFGKAWLTVLENQLACGLFEEAEDTFLNAFEYIDSQLSALLSSSKNDLRIQSRLLSSKKSLEKVRFQCLNARRIDEANSLWSSRRIQHSFDCDVICIASDEAPYLHEFIHHYLYLGFSNIFIGVNNSTDKTLEFAKKIASVDPRVHVINTDDVHVELTQRSSYSKLYHCAAAVTRSSYCLFVDVDEFWVAQPFPTKVRAYLQGFSEFDSLACNWVNCFYEDQFSPPLSRSLSFNSKLNPGLDYRLKRNVKSFVAYGANIVELQCHSPVFRNPSARVSDAFGNSLSLAITTIGFQAPGGVLSEGTQFNSRARTSIIFHRHNRSVLEYSYRMFKPHANQKKFWGGALATIPFKENRPGCNNITGREISDSFINQLLPSGPNSDYYRSLVKFIQVCCSTEEIDDARRSISDQEIKLKCTAVDRDTLVRSRSIWEKGFSGTPYLELLRDLVVKTEKNDVC